MKTSPIRRVENDKIYMQIHLKWTESCFAERSEEINRLFTCICYSPTKSKLNQFKQIMRPPQK